MSLTMLSCPLELNPCPPFCFSYGDLDAVSRVCRTREGPEGEMCCFYIFSIIKVVLRYMKHFNCNGYVVFITVL